MSEQRLFRFAVQAYNASASREWRETARRAEALGYSALHVCDHYIGAGPALDPTGHPVQELAAIPAIATAAAATETLRIGARVLCVDYHHPVVLAKELASLDLLSDGRLEIGLGAGWLDREYAAMGIQLDRAGTRIDRVVETIGLLRAFFAGEQLEIDGEHVHAVGFAGVPRPVQRPHPPFLVGGGARRILGIAGREADIVSFNFDNSSGKIGVDGLQSGTADHLLEKLDWVKAGAGARFDQLELELGAYFTSVTEDAESALSGLSARLGVPPEFFQSYPFALIGDADEIADVLRDRREQFGISYITVGVEVMDSFAPVVAALAGT